MPSHRTEADWLTIVRRKIDERQCFEAFDEARAGLEHYPESKRLSLLAALAAVRSGAAATARDLVPECGETADGDALSLLGEVDFELWRLDNKHSDLIRSHALHARAFHEHGLRRSGSDAAMAAWLLGDKNTARTLAEKLAEQYRSASELAAMIAHGEAELLLGHFDSAKKAYAEAASQADYSVVVEARHRVELLLHHGLNVPSSILEVLRPPTVVVFSGQPLDEPGQGEQLFPVGLTGPVKEEIGASLAVLDAEIGYCCAASGADLLFAEAMLERGAEVHLFLPFAVADFIAARVAYAGAEWVQRFEWVMERAATVTFATEERFLGHEILFRYNNQIINGMARLRAELLGTRPYLLLVWDYSAAADAGTTADFMDQWEDVGRLRLIDLDDLRERHFDSLPPPQPSSVPKATLLRMEPERVLKCMLFADIVGFSKLREEELPGLWGFLAEVREATDDHCAAPLLLESWGDALYVVMDAASDLLQYALVLQQQFAVMDPSRYGFSEPLSLRVGLHAGPVFQGEHPLTGKPIIYGSHVSRTARIEPVTLPGQVYGSQQFVALLTAEESVRRYEADVTGKSYRRWYACDYLGTQQLAKRYGKQPVYHLRAIDPAALDGASAVVLKPERSK